MQSIALESHLGFSSVSQNAIDVVAGIIFNTDKTQVLLSLRKPDQHQGNCWEFPGGKVESAETGQQTLLRELNEELGIQVLECESYCKVEHDYGDKQVRLHFWQVTQFEGMPTGREAQKLAWVSIDELQQLDFPEANQIVVDRLVDHLAS